MRSTCTIPPQLYPHLVARVLYFEACNVPIPSLPALVAQLLLGPTRTPFDAHRTGRGQLDDLIEVYREHPQTQELLKGMLEGRFNFPALTPSQDTPNIPLEPWKAN
jgi:hypothetical protein